MLISTIVGDISFQSSFADRIH